jgi:hypothetical protein
LKIFYICDKKKKKSDKESPNLFYNIIKASIGNNPKPVKKKAANKK